MLKERLGSSNTMQLHISDGPATRYKNRRNFAIISSACVQDGISASLLELPRSVTWQRSCWRNRCRCEKRRRSQCCTRLILFSIYHNCVPQSMITDKDIDVFSQCVPERVGQNEMQHTDTSDCVSAAIRHRPPGVIRMIYSPVATDTNLSLLRSQCRPSPDWLLTNHREPILHDWP